MFLHHSIWTVQSGNRRSDNAGHWSRRNGLPRERAYKRVSARERWTHQPDSLHRVPGSGKNHRSAVCVLHGVTMLRKRRRDTDHQGNNATGNARESGTYTSGRECDARAGVVRGVYHLLSPTVWSVCIYR